MIPSGRGTSLRSWGALFLAFGGVACSSSDPAAPAVQTGTDPFCSTRPKLQFCEDFDTTDLPGSFGEQDATGGTLSLTSETASSVPRSLVAQSSGNGQVVLKHTFTEGSKFRLFMQVFVANLPAPNGDANAYTELASLGFIADAPYRLGFGLAGDGTWVVLEELGGTVNRIPAAAPLMTGQWTSVRFDVDLLPEGNTVFVRFGDETAVPHTAITPPLSTRIPSVSLGLVAKGMPAWNVGYDNITFQVD